MDIFRELNETEEKEFRQWARDNWTVGSIISSAWHPVVQDECLKMKKESGELKEGYYWGCPTVLSKPQPIGFDGEWYHIMGVGDPLRSVHKLGEYIGNFEGEK